MSEIDKPALVWRHYLGGALGANQLVTQDVNGDGSREVVLVLGGSLVAKTPYDNLLWRTPVLDLSRIDAVTDLDGDGRPEVVASAPFSLYVISASDGTVLWQVPKTGVGIVGAVRLADMNNDALPDLYVSDRGCGSAESLGDAAEVWSFANGASSPMRLFQLERGRRDYACGTNDVVADINGDGKVEIVTQGDAFLYVYSGADGSFISASESVSSISYGQAFVQVGNVDADAGQELVCFTDNTYGDTRNSRRVFLMDWDPGANRLVRRWERSAIDPAKDRHYYGAGGLGDLGSDGQFELVTSFHSSAADTWTTVVLDAATGAERASVAGGPFRGLADVDGDGMAEIVSGDRGRGLTVYRWATGNLTTLFTATHAEPLEVRARDATSPSIATNRLLTLDLNSDSSPELVAVAYGPDGFTQEALIALSGNGMSTGHEQARLALNSNVAVLSAALSPAITRDTPQILIARSDGYLWILDSKFAFANLPVDAPRKTAIRIGGYYGNSFGVGRSPLAADLDGTGMNDLIMVDSRSVLQRLAVSGASRTTVPEIKWEVAGTRMPVILDVQNEPAVAYWSTSSSASLNVIRAANADPLWQRTMGSEQLTPVNDLMVGDVDGDGQDDLVYSLLSSTDQSLRINVAGGANGRQAWASDVATVVPGGGFGAGSLHDRDGDGAIDVLAALRSELQWLNGPDGARGAKAGAHSPYYGLFGNIDADAESEIISSGTSGRGLDSFDLNLPLLWTSPGTIHTQINGTLVTCPNEPRYVSAHRGNTRLTAWNAMTGDIVGDIALKSGQQWQPDQVPDGVGRLGNLTLSRDLTGNGLPGVLVPSTDGHLYAVDPCAMGLTWAFDFGYAMGEAIFADTDGDGKDEIVVTVADGFMYGLDRETFPAPAYVYENDGKDVAADAMHDVDAFVTTDTLHANWAAVEGALHYEYAVVTDDGTFATSPSFIDVGTKTSVTAGDLTLTPNTKYYFAVRAIGAAGTSPERLSDGVLVLESVCDACAADEQCRENRCVPLDPCSACGECTLCMDARCLGVCSANGSDDLDAGTVDQCSYCSAGTRCMNGLCIGTADVLRSNAGGCCSVAGRRSTVGAWLGIALIALAYVRRARRR
jgi:hypothetical protein